ncbi:MAG: hypothetical protein DSY59_01525, partial [Persephonella sp.]
MVCYDFSDYNINKDLSNIFRKMGAIYEFLDDKFRSLAYYKAADILEDLPDDVRNYILNGKLYSIRGIGQGIATKIEEYVETGKIQKYEELKNLVPEEFIELMDLKGIGPKTLKRLYDELGISTKDELVKALKDVERGSDNFLKINLNISLSLFKMGDYEKALFVLENGLNSFKG